MKKPPSGLWNQQDSQRRLPDLLTFSVDILELVQRRGRLSAQQMLTRQRRFRRLARSGPSDEGACHEKIWALEVLAGNGQLDARTVVVLLPLTERGRRYA